MNPGTVHHPPVHSTVELGAILRSRRKAQGLTLEQLSGLSGLGIRFLSELERGKATAELGKSLQVAALLGLDCFLIPRSRLSPGEGGPDDGEPV